MKTAWMNSAGHLFLVRRYDDGSYGVSEDDEFRGFVVRTEGAYVAIDDDGAVRGEAASLGAAARLLAIPALPVTVAA